MTTVTDPYQVGMFYAVKYYLDVELPENSLSDYVLEVRDIYLFYIEPIS